MPRIRPTRRMITIADDGSVYLSGIEMNSKGTVLAKNDDYIVIKWSGGKHWNGNFSPWAYHSPKTQVWRIIDDRDDMITPAPPNTPTRFRAEECIEWSNARKGGK